MSLASRKENDHEYTRTKALPLLRQPGCDEDLSLCPEALRVYTDMHSDKLCRTCSEKMAL